MEEHELEEQVAGIVDFPMQSRAGLNIRPRNSSTSTVNMPTYSQPPDMAASRNYNPSSTQRIPSIMGASFQYGINHWSIIPISQQPAMLDALSKHCHSLEHLWKNQYLLHPYSSDDIASLGKCRNCRGRFQGIMHYK